MSAKISVIIPTYSGIDHIEECLNSILAQSLKPNSYEMVVVIDGSQRINEIVENTKYKFINKGIHFESIFLKRNHGRFEARMIGAKAARCEQLLFVDDRVELGPNFFSYINETKEKTVMPNVQEIGVNNVISDTISMLRKQLWGLKSKPDFKDYYINSRNFEKSPKGTTSLYVSKKAFLSACNKVQASMSQSDTRRISDDTKILYQIVTDGTRIFRTPKLNVYYSPRSSFRAVLLHLFWRGPKFVDYYLRPTTKFFPLLIAIYLAVAALVAVALLSPAWLLYCLEVFIILTIISAALIAENTRQFFVALIGLPLTIVTFSAGILVGTLLKIIGR